ncbi:Na-translocating system protein MpsC family protein [Planococcus sp. CAU13]|uniref:Na-translocating system protein MpsC family protein n=1 Tax=Planococcus sp. CAU13 TaxID=1541197 RepID=UPI00052FF0A7|nr:Na-translocating system protein MpsC family protein [Planococcus sp. CAU13]
MPKERNIETEIGGFISTLLRKHFGKGPTSVYVSVNPPYISIHFRGFSTTMEKILMKQDEWKRVLETRNLLVNDLKPIIQEHLKNLGGWTIEEFYVEWNLELETGTFLTVLEDSIISQEFSWPSDDQKTAFETAMQTIESTLNRDPEQTESHWLNERTLLIKWTGVLTGIEQALIADGYSEILKYTKRSYERSVLEKAGFENVFERRIQELFMDWNFDLNVGYVIFVLEAKR